MSNYKPASKYRKYRIIFVYINPPFIFMFQKQSAYITIAEFDFIQVNTFLITY